MRKLYLDIPAALICTLALAVTAESAHAQTAPPEDITIDACAAKRPAVAFPHKDHFDRLECKTCHHSQEDLTLEAVAGGMTVEGCADCHLKPEEEDTPICTEQSLKTNPFHILCVDCHKEKLAEDESLSAPTKCAQCHPKEEEAEEG